MSKCAGLITHQADSGLLYVFVPGKHPDLVIDERKTSIDEQRFRVGDFISFIDVNGSITSPKRMEKLFETRFLNNRLQVQVSVVFPPEEFSVVSNYKTLAWSPDFAFVGCSPDVVKRFCRNQIYMAWIERLVFVLDSPAYYRVPRMIQKVAGILVSWQIVDDVFDKCDEQNRQLISKAYIDNYQGLVTEVNDSSAKVWSLAIPDSEVVFLFGARDGMKVGDWVQFNCAPSIRPYLNCYLHGKKFLIIEPVLPAKPFNNTVQVEIMMTITVDNLKYYPTGEVTVETEMLGAVEFGSGRFRKNYYNRCLTLIVCKNRPSKQTGSVWQVFCVVIEGCVEFMQQSNSSINFPNTNGNPAKKFVSMKKNKCNAEIEINDYPFDENKLQEDLSSDLPGPSQKEADCNFCSDFSYNDNTFGNREEEYDPLIEPAFGAVQPHVLQINSSLHSNGTDGLNTSDSPNINLNEEFSDDEQEDLDNRATEYWIRVWQIPEVRQQIAKADREFYVNVMQLMTDLSARTDGDTLEEALKQSL
ncbi:unnamed protein product [Onchocerca ochengi]|uniref:S1-like domain-containing protein n=1 Tax=Onchocerca ochengi TaxID=42157 RepID=A0A182E6B9_ONCOC|nr:unnamed protein product [Onchocerca ochengi]